MFNLGFSSKILTLVRDGGGRSPSRAGVRQHVNLETLEGRALLSTVAHPTVAAQVEQNLMVHVPKHPHPGPIVNEIGVGYAVKSPRFYPYYTGAYRGELNAAGMKATYDASGNLILTGIIAGTINPKPTTDAESEYYVFGIDRGLTTGAGPFPDRPRIKYDAVVAVAITPTGTSAVVADLSTDTVTPIDPSGVVVQSNDFKVYVPAGTPGISSTTTGATNPHVVFWTQDDTPSASPNPADIASFAPDGRSVLIAGGVGIAPNPLLG